MKKKKLKFIGIFTSILLFIAMLLIIYLIAKLNILPFHYLILFIVLVSFIGMFLIKIMLLKKYKAWLKIVAIISSFILILMVGIGTIYINKTYHFIGNINNNNMYENYYIITLKDSDIKNIEDINLLGVFIENTDTFEKAFDKIEEKVDSEVYSSINSLKEGLLEEDVDSIFISGVMYDYLCSEDSKFESKVKKIYEDKIEKVQNTIEKSNKDVTKDTFIIYVSGIDIYGDISLRSRSDVNMVVTVNPRTKDVLITSIPRDYYVELPMYNSYDKLTHAGMFGVDSSIEAIEKLLDIDIDYYVRVNFSTLINVVDLIGGIDVVSDRTLTPYTNNKITIQKGLNHMDGAMALAYARERYAYEEGDRHRVANQQDVITAIIKKLTSSADLFTKYTKLLDSISSSFQTNIEMEELTAIINYQLAKMPSWNLYRYSLNGENDMAYTYSMGEQMLFVMKPDYETVDLAKKYINGMMNNKKLSELGL